jgi:hypothetical protein
MDAAVEEELETMLGFMRACRQSVAAIEEEQMPGPALPSPAGYVCRMTTWSQASGALRMLEHLRLIAHEERLAWEREAQAVVDPNYP